jgi:ABC-type transport system involved in multi-copper enzyme maturation permease subunit
MEATPEPKPVKYNRLLPYWAVLQYDVHQTLRSWVYRFWVLVSVLAMTGYLLYRMGPYREAGIIQPASAFLSDLLRWTVLGSATLIVVLTAGVVSSERGTMADSVLSRGISRYQYFLGKWHARLAAILGTYLVLGLVALLCGLFLLHEDLSWRGCLIGLATVAALLTAVISCSVAVSAMVSSTLLGVAVLWILLYGSGFALESLPKHFPTPNRALHSLPWILQGHYDLGTLTQLMGWCLAISVAAAVCGLVYFARRDV